MTLRTASEGISFARELETRLGAFYGAIGERWPEVRDVLAPFAAGSAKCIADVQRAYYGVITDAIEGGFCFELEPTDYPAADPSALPEDVEEAVAQAAVAEESICRFYEDAAEQSRGLLADMPRIFDRIVLRRRAALAELKAFAAKKEA